jgi:hypothetical protein
LLSFHATAQRQWRTTSSVSAALLASAYPTSFVPLAFLQSRIHLTFSITRESSRNHAVGAASFARFTFNVRMIATAGGLISPHESTTKNTSACACPTTTPPMSTDHKAVVKTERKEEDDDEQEVASEDESGSEESEEEQTNVSGEELKLLNLDTLDLSSGKKGADATAASASTAVAPVKRIRRRRKRMSEDERRVRHREVQRQFMKRKRARLNEMRKTIRGLEAHRRLVQATNEREQLEKLNTEFQELLSGPGSGWQWDDAPSVEGEKIRSSSNPLAMQPQLPHPDHAQIHQFSMEYMHQPLPSLHAQQQHPPGVYADPHTTAHRLSADGVPLPWDDILDAITGDYSF